MTKDVIFVLKQWDFTSCNHVIISPHFLLHTPGGAHTLIISCQYKSIFKDAMPAYAAEVTAALVTCAVLALLPGCAFAMPSQVYPLCCIPIHFAFFRMIHDTSFISLITLSPASCAQQPPEQDTRFVGASQHADSAPIARPAAAGPHVCSGPGSVAAPQHVGPVLHLVTNHRPSAHPPPPGGARLAAMLRTWWCTHRGAHRGHAPCPKPCRSRCGFRSSRSSAPSSRTPPS